MIHCQNEDKAGSVFGHFLTSQELKFLKLLSLSILAIKSQRHTRSIIRYNIRIVLNKTGPLYISGFSLIPMCLQGVNVILQKIETYLLENKIHSERELRVQRSSRIESIMSKVEVNRRSRVQRRRLQHLLFIFCITYLFLKLFFPSTLVQGSGSPSGFLGFQFYSHSIIPVTYLNPEYPRPSGGSP